MGWLHTKGQTKKELIENLTTQTADDGTKVCTHHKTIGNNLWAIFSDGKEDSFIVLFLLRSDKDFGWGYKDVSEHARPYYYTCPLEYLDIAPVVSEEWRKKVVEHHAEKSAQKENLKNVMAELAKNPDDSYIVLPDGYNPRLFKFVEFKKKSVIGFNGRRWKITPKYLNVAEVKTHAELN